jgi:hypothetical protein
MQTELPLGIDPAGNHIALDQVENHLMLVGPHGSGKGTVMLRAARDAAAKGLEVLVIDVSRPGQHLRQVVSSVHCDSIPDAATAVLALHHHLNERLLHGRRNPWGLLLLHGLQELDAGLDKAHHRVLARVLLQAEAAGLRIISTTTSTGGRVRRLIRQTVHGGAVPAVMLMGAAPHFVLSVARRDAPMPEVEHDADLGRGTLVSPRRGSEVSLAIPPLAL